MLTRMWREQTCQPLGEEEDNRIRQSLSELHHVEGFSGVMSADLFRTLDLGRDAEAIDLMSKVGSPAAWLAVATRVRCGVQPPRRYCQSLCH
jgi:hypothetical protein